MRDPNIAMLRLAASRLGDVVEDVVFVGGSVVGLLISDPAAPEIRPTDDVDVIVEVVGYGQYQKIVERLRTNGFVDDTREGAPVCRFVNRETVLDLMPTDDGILGFANPWYSLAVRTATRFNIGSAVKSESLIRLASSRLN